MMPGDIPGLIQKAIRFQQDNRLDDAADCYHQVLAVDPCNADALYLLGIIALSRKDLDAAEECLRLATRHHPEIAKMHAQLGSIYLEKKRYDDAVRCYQSAICAEPANPLYRYNLGCLYTSIGQHDLALEQYQQALLRNYSSSDLYLNLGLSYIEQDEVEKAIASLVKSLDLAPQDHRAMFNLARALEQAQDFSNALTCFAEALRLAPGNPTYQLGFIEHLDKNAMAAFTETINRQILACVDSRHVPTVPLANVLVRALKADPGIGKYLEPPFHNEVRSSFENGLLASLAKNKLFHSLVNNFLVADWEVEKFLTGIRNFLFEQVDLEQCKPPPHYRDFLPLVALLLRQNHLNEYVYLVSEAEAEKLSRLAACLQGIRGAEEVDDEKRYLYLLYCLYQPPYSIPNHEWFTKGHSGGMAGMQEVSEICQNHRLEQVLKTRITSFGRISPDSAHVRQQYEENPYPRWHRLVLPLPNSQPVTRRTGLLKFHDPGKAWSPGRILVAGCGTGQECIQVSSIYPEARITAIDLSLASLAYSRRMSDVLEVHNIEYLHGDILQLHELGRKFDLVISSGVIHHMQEPEKGLQQLVRCLEPGGVLKLSLYSTLARRPIHAIRARLRGQLSGLDARQIRLARHNRQLLDPDDPGVRNNIMRSVDFYSLSACRDLLFHLQETTYTLSGISSLLERNHLRLVGMDVDRELLDNFRRQYPDAKDYRDLHKWEAFENVYPDTFRGMYSFWLESE